MKIHQSAYNLIKRSEKLFKTDMVYVAKNGIWVMIGQIISIISAFSLSILFANLLPMQEYGVYKYVLSFVGMISAFTLTGMNSAVVQSSSRGFDKTLFAAIKLSVKWNLIPLTFYLISSSYYYLSDNTTLSISIICAGGLNILVNSFGLYGSYLVGKQKFKLASIYSIYTQVINITSIATILFITENVLYIVIVNFLSTALMVLTFFLLTMRNINRSSEVSVSSLRFGKHMSFMNIISTITTHLDKILIFQKLGAIELAIYSFAIAIPEQARGVFKNIISIAVPKYTLLNKAQLRHSIKSKICTLTIIMSIFVLTYILISPYFFKLIFPKYLESVFYSQIYILGLLTIPSIFLLNTYFQVQESTKTLYYINTFSSIADLILTIFLIYYFGLLGGVILNFVSRLITTILYFIFFYKDSRT